MTAWATDHLSWTNHIGSFLRSLGSEQSQWRVTKWSCKKVWRLLFIIMTIHNIYLTLFCFSKHSKRFTLWRGNLLINHQCAASTWMMRRQPYCPERPPHTSLLVEMRQSDAANQQIWVLLGHDGQRPMEKFGQDAEVTPLLLSKYIRRTDETVYGN